MKKLCLVNKLWLAGLAIGLFACNGIFVPDPIDPRLPKYTESGNNVAGAFVGNKIWESQLTWSLYGYSYAPLMNVWPEKDSIVLRFPGSAENKHASIEFSLHESDVDGFEDISHLEGQKIVLDGVTNKAFYIRESKYQEAYKNRGVGQLYIRKVELNASLSSAIFSGTFGFSVTDSIGNTTKISYGRFDYRLGKESNFFISTEQ